MRWAEHSLEKAAWLVVGLFVLTLLAPLAFQDIWKALGDELPQGRQGEGHAQYHGQYTQFFNNKKGVSCCNDRDCRPTQAKQVTEGDAPHWEVLIEGKWIRVDDDAIIPKSLDGIAHVCAGTPTSMDPAGRIYCVILPPLS